MSARGLMVLKVLMDVQLGPPSVGSVSAAILSENFGRGFSSLQLSQAQATRRISTNLGPSIRDFSLFCGIWKQAGSFQCAMCITSAFGDTLTFGWTLALPFIGYSNFGVFFSYTLNTKV